jgi:hypothetical protein
MLLGLHLLKPRENLAFYRHDLGIKPFSSCAVTIGLIWRNLVISPQIFEVYSGTEPQTC